MSGDAGRAIERVARLSYGKLVALLAVRSRDIAAAEDALSAALVRALEDWPRAGVPDNPEAWLLAAARRIEIDRWRRGETARAGERTLLEREEDRMAATPSPFPDERLALMLACAHPEIDPRIRTPLMLQVVLGLDARRIASAFLVAPATLGQRLSRAKSRIAALGLRYEPPDRADLAPRVAAVLDAVYVAYTVGRDAAPGDGWQVSDLAEEAVWLARVIADLLPGEAEAQALLALMLFGESRRAARRDPANGRYVPLDAQDPSRWDEALIDEAETRLRAAGRLGPPDRFGLEAAIQAVHADRRRTGRVDWAAVEHLYRGLVRVSPTVGARIGHAVARARLDGAAAGLALLSDIPAALVEAHQPYWAARAHLAAGAGDVAAALAAYDRAIGLTEDPAARAFLSGARARLLV